MTITVSINKKNKQTIIRHSELLGIDSMEVYKALYGDKEYLKKYRFGTVSYKNDTMKISFRDDFIEDLVGMCHSTFLAVKGVIMALSPMFESFTKKYLEPVDEKSSKHSSK